MLADIPECSSGISGCHENADCMEIPGSFECQCKQGFSGNGFQCEGNTPHLVFICILKVNWHTNSIHFNIFYCQLHHSTLVGKSTTFNYVFLAQNEAKYRETLFNKMVQQTSWQTNLHVYFRREDTPVWSCHKYLNKHVSRTCWQQTVVSPFDLARAHRLN